MDETSELGEPIITDGSTGNKNIRICLVGKMSQNREVCYIAVNLGLPVLVSEKGLEISDDNSWVTIFIVDDFEQNIHGLEKPPHRILGFIAFQQLYRKQASLSCNTRPLFNLAMSGVVACFTGFRQKKHLQKLLILVHNMNGSFRKEMSGSVTHLIANICNGAKYRYATTFKVPIMHESWITSSWEQRNDVDFYATNETFFTEYKLKPFYGARVCFIGFSLDETQHMQEVLEANGGKVTDLDDSLCTHVVSGHLLETPTQESISATTPILPLSSQRRKRYSTPHLSLSGKRRCSFTNSQVSPRVSQIFKQDCFEKYNKTSSSKKCTNTTMSVTQEDKENCRRDLRRSFSNENCAMDSSITEKIALQKAFVVKPVWFWSSVQNVACQDETDYLFHDGLCNTPNINCRGRRKRFPNSNEYSLSSILDCTGTPEETELPTPRKRVFLELLQTEFNYVRILEIIIKSFKEPLENIPENESLLNSTEIKVIFGNVLPLYNIHKRILEEFHSVSKHWTENTSIGKIIKSFSNDFLKAYPPFINFFETMKATLIKCDQTKPRFHAFLKIGEMKPECGRQPLQDLLIRPVQRLPSISLLLTDILKHTDTSNTDHLELEEALSVIKQVMTHINENKRKTEEQVAIFEIFNEIENCPADLISSHRNFLIKCDAVEVTNELNCRGCELVLFVFTDQLEICKKRSRRLTIIASSTPNGTLSTRNIFKPYKHVCTIALNTVKRVIDVQEIPNHQKQFGLSTKHQDNDKEKLYMFAVLQDLDKSNFLKILCDTVRNTNCDVKIVLEADQLNITTNDLNSSKIYKTAKKTRNKVGRVFSFKKGNIS